MQEREVKERVVAIKKKIPYMYNGNVMYIDGSNTYCLEDEKCRKISKDYYYMEYIFTDHYIVCDASCGPLFGEFDDSKLKFKYGVIALQRDMEGKIIPMAEKEVVPMLYDRLVPGNLDIVIGCGEDGKWTYIACNPGTVNGGKQLVPAVLEHACAFSLEYEGFAECSVDGVDGYLHRSCNMEIEKLTSDDLLTREEVEYMISCLDVDNIIYSITELGKAYSHKRENQSKTLKRTK